MDELRITKQLVHAALKTSEQCRNSDNFLYYVVCKAKLAAKGISIDEISFKDALLRRNELGLPVFESCRRSRQKLQREFPELAGTAEVEAMRVVNEEAYREFAKNG